MDTIAAFVRAAWTGRAPLWQVFWLGGEVGGPLLASILFVAIPIGPFTPYALLVGLLYLVWICVSMWRCAYNVRAKQWGGLARMYIVVAVPISIAGALKVLQAASNASR